MLPGLFFPLLETAIRPVTSMGLDLSASRWGRGTHVVSGTQTLKKRKGIRLGRKGVVQNVWCLYSGCSVYFHPSLLPRPSFSFCDWI